MLQTINNSFYNAAKTETLMFRQFIFKNLNAQEYIINLLKEGMHILQQIKSRTKDSIIIPIFEECFKFLLNFIENDNKSTKKMLYDQHFHFFLTFME